MRDGFAVAALQKLTTLDFPGVVSAMVYTQGCNFHCPYCHNRHLIPPGRGPVAPDTVLDFLRKRAGLLDGLVISGGEPTLQPGLAAFCREVKALGYRIKLDSNGSRPAVLEELLRGSLLDYAAIDLKTAPDAYRPALTAETGMESALAESVGLLRRYRLAHELRTTCVSPFVDAALPEAVAPLAGDAPWLLQRARLAPESEKAGLSTLPNAALQALAAQGRALGLRAAVRE